MFVAFLLATFISLSSNNFQTPFFTFVIHILYYSLLRYIGLYKKQSELNDRNNFNKQSNYQHQNDMHWYLIFAKADSGQLLFSKKSLTKTKK
jgi:hypothetical protein